MPTHHAGPDAIGHGNIGGQHPDDTRAYGSRGMVYTTTRMVYHYSETAEEYVRTVKPLGIQDMWGSDEKERKVRGEEWWIVTVMCITTRFILAWDISDTKKEL